MKKSLSIVLLCSAWLSVGSICFAAEATETQAETTESVTLNLKDTDLRVLIETMSQMTGKNFIVDPRVKGKVTVVSSTPVSPDQAYEIFVSVLKVHGFAIVPSGKVLKVIPEAGAKQDSIPSASQQQVKGDNLVTTVVKLKYSDASQLMPILKPLLAQNAHIAPHPSSNTLLITDSAQNINRIIGIIEELDVEDGDNVEIVPLANTQAGELAKTLESVKGTRYTKSPALRQKNIIVADERTNSLILNGDSEWRLNTRRLIKQLDRPTTKDDYTEVIYLKHAKAENLVNVLQGVAMHQLQTSGAPGKANTASQQLDIRADETTNALIISAPPSLARSLKSVIEKLDIRRAQVHIQAIIAEVKYDKSVEFGIEWSSDLSSDGTIGISTLPVTSGVTSSINSFPGSIGSGFSLGYVSGGTLRGLIKAFAADGDTNILSTPSLVTLDNEEAMIHVGQNVPFVTGSYTVESDDNPFQTIERQDVGIKLTVKPHINEGDTIALNIEQEVSNVDTKSSVEGLVTNNRLIKTTVLVDNEEIIVLGGLIQDELSENTSKVPLLGDLPLLGNLFRSQVTEKQKRNLMVFLRPQIIWDKETSKQITHREYTSMLDLQKGLRASGINLMPNEQRPQLEELNPLDAAAAADTVPADKPLTRNTFLEEFHSN